MSNDIQFIPMTCPSCGGQLMISEKQEKAICNYCGNPFLLSKNTNSAHESVENFLKLAKTAEELNRFDEASNYYDRALELDPDNYLAWYGKAIAHGWSSSTGELLIGEAVTYFNKSIENAPQIEKSTIEQNAYIDTALMYGSYSQILREYYVKYMSAIRKDKQNVNLYSKQITDVYFDYKYKMLEITVFFHNTLDKIVDKQTIQASLTHVLSGLLTMREEINIHYRLEGFFSEKYVPDKSLKLEPEIDNLVYSVIKRIMILLKPPGVS